MSTLHWPSLAYSLLGPIAINVASQLLGWDDARTGISVAIFLGLLLVRGRIDRAAILLAGVAEVIFLSDPWVYWVALPVTFVAVAWWATAGNSAALTAASITPRTDRAVVPAAQGDVDRYLADVNHTVITEFWGDKTEAVDDGGPPQSLPGTQDFWVASATGSGAQTVEWDPADGSWTVVVMNADGRPGIDVGADLGARVPALPWIALGVLVAGAVFLAGGALLIAAAFRRNRTPTTELEEPCRR